MELARGGRLSLLWEGKSKPATGLPFREHANLASCGGHFKNKAEHFSFDETDVASNYLQCLLIPASLCPPVYWSCSGFHIVLPKTSLFCPCDFSGYLWPLDYCPISGLLIPFVNHLFLALATQPPSEHYCTSQSMRQVDFRLLWPRPTIKLLLFFPCNLCTHTKIF